MQSFWVCPCCSADKCWALDVSIQNQVLLLSCDRGSLVIRQARTIQELLQKHLWKVVRAGLVDLVQHWDGEGRGVFTLGRKQVDYGPEELKMTSVCRAWWMMCSGRAGF